MVERRLVVMIGAVISACNGRSPPAAVPPPQVYSILLSAQGGGTEPERAAVIGSLRVP